MIQTAEAENIPLETPLLAIPPTLPDGCIASTPSYVIEEGEVAGQWGSHRA